MQETWVYILNLTFNNHGNFVKTMNFSWASVSLSLIWYNKNCHAFLTAQFLEATGAIWRNIKDTYNIKNYKLEEKIGP